jgi:hypothetical protein
MAHILQGLNFKRKYMNQQNLIKIKQSVKIIKSIKIKI